MKTSNHTPGPWRIEQTDTITDFTIIPHFQKARQKKNPIGFTYQAVCRVSRSTVKDVGIHKPEFQHDALPQGEAIANARLIAAAPDMLAALEDCITEQGAIAERSHEYALQRLASINEVARAAIAKATGKD